MGGREPYVRNVEVASASHAALADLCARLSRCLDLDSLVDVTVAGLADLLGHDHSIIFLAGETGERLFTIGSHGYAEQGVGAEVAVGDGIAGLAAARCAPMSAANLHQMTRYGRSMATSFQDAAELGPGRVVPMPGLVSPGSQLAVPAVALGELVGVVLVESRSSDRFGDADIAMLTVVATLLASTVERLRTEVREARPATR